MKQDQFEKILSQLGSNTNTTLTLPASDPLNIEQVYAFARLLEENTTLLSLTLENYNDNAIKLIAEALKMNNTLTSLQVIHKFPKLNVKKVKITDQGAFDLAQMLKANKSIKTLKIINGKVRDAGAQYLAEALQINSTLAELSLDGNKIGDVGAEAILQALNSSSINNLYLSSNKVSKVVAQKLADALITTESKQSILNNKKIYSGHTTMNVLGTICFFPFAGPMLISKTLKAHNAAKNEKHFIRSLEKDPFRLI